MESGCEKAGQAHINAPNYGVGYLRHYYILKCILRFSPLFQHLSVPLSVAMENHWVHWPQHPPLHSRDNILWTQRLVIDRKGYPANRDSLFIDEGLMS